MTREEAEKKAQDLVDWYHTERNKIVGGYGTDQPSLREHLATALLSAFEAGRKAQAEKSASIAFEKIRCDDRTDRWQVANEVWRLISAPQSMGVGKTKI